MEKKFIKIRDEFLVRVDLVQFAMRLDVTIPSKQSIRLSELLINEWEVSYIKTLNKTFNVSIPMPSKLRYTEDIKALSYEYIIKTYGN